MGINILYDDILVEVALEILGLILIYVRTICDHSYLAWIGRPLVLVSVFYHSYKLSKKAKEKGVTVLAPMS